MEIKIKIAQKGQAGDCLLCVKDSALWDAYFKSGTTAENEIEEMIAQQQIYVATNAHEECLGFMGVIDQGCFRKFSYLSLIAVKKSDRGNGIGKQLMDKFEKHGFEKADRVFLLVSDFNVKAQRLYQKLGYQKVGEVPGLFKPGVSENILVKSKTAFSASVCAE